MLYRHLSSGARRWTLGGILALVLAFGAALLPAPPAHSATGGSTIHALVNEARSANGQPGLLRNAALDDVAAAWAEQLAASGVLSHNPSYSAQIPGGWVSAGENVAQGQPTEGAMHDAWMNSSGHRANVLGDFTDVGIAFLSAGGTTWGVEVFASYPGHVPPAAPAAPAAEPAPAPVAEEPPAAVPAPTKGRTSAAPAELETEAAPGPTVTPTPTSTPRPAATYRSTATRETDASNAAPADDPFGVWMWIGIPAVTGVAAAAGVVVLLRSRGLIGPRGGRHSAE